MATLLELRERLNIELGIADSDESAYTIAARNQAIADGYAALWPAGVWRALAEEVATASTTDDYPTTIQRLERLEILDQTGLVLTMPRGIIEEDGYGAWQVRVKGRLAEGATLRIRGWVPYASDLVAEEDTDDLPPQHTRVPLLKAKAILFRAQMAKFAQYGVQQSIPPPMNTTMEGLLGLVAAAEREFAEEAQRLSDQRRRASHITRL